MLLATEEKQIVGHALQGNTVEHLVWRSHLGTATLGSTVQVVSHLGLRQIIFVLQVIIVHQEAHLKGRVLPAHIRMSTSRLVVNPVPMVSSVMQRS